MFLQILFLMGFGIFMTIRENLLHIKHTIADAATRIGKNPNDIHLVAVTKTIDVERMKEAIQCGVDSVGENRVQEALEKHAAFQDIDLHVAWHLVGHLQTNKVKKAVEIFDLIHSVDSSGLIIEIAKYAAQCGKTQDVLVQVNTAGEDTKFGVEPDDVLPLLDTITHHSTPISNIRIRGIMTIGPLSDDTTKIRDCFKRTKDIFDACAAHFPSNKLISMDYLSMGMSNDYALAVAEGANLLRIGTALFGART